MASVTKPKGAKTWIAQYRIPAEMDPSGKVKRWKQISKSTGIEASRSEAQKAATRMEDEARRQASGVGGGATNEELFQLLARAIQLREQGKLTEAVVRNMIAGLYRGPDGKRLQFYTIAEWLREWLHRKESKISPRTLNSYQKSINDFILFLGDRASQPLETVTNDFVELWQRNLISDGDKRQSTCNHRVRVIRIAFRAAVSAKLIPESPTDRIELLPEDDSLNREPFEVDEIARLYCAAIGYNPSWGMVVLLGAYTGLRLQDCARLQKSALDRTKMVLNVQPMKQRRMKRKQTLAIPLHPKLAEALMSFKSSDPVYFFPDLANRNCRLSDDFLEIMKRANVSRNLVKRKGLKVIGRKSFHSLRHAANSLMANAGVSQQERMEILGHASEVMNDHYTHFELERLRKAVSVLPNFDILQVPA